MTGDPVSPLPPCRLRETCPRPPPWSEVPLGDALVGSTPSHHPPSPHGRLRARTQPPRASLQGLMHSSGPVGRHRQLVLVLEGELYLIPFALLKGSSSNEYLYERFALIAVPSIRSLSPQSKVSLRCCGGRAVRSWSAAFPARRGSRGPRGLSSQCSCCSLRPGRLPLESICPMGETAPLTPHRSLLSPKAMICVISFKMSLP